MNPAMFGKMFGRPLTKKSNISYYDAEDDEGYGISPVERPGMDRFFSSPMQEDEWAVLAREIDRTCSDVKASAILAFNPVRGRTMDTKVIKESKSTVNPSCRFCFKNGSVRSMVESHFLRDPITKVLTCPVLRKYVCELCGATGDNAHTRYYCPDNKDLKKAPTAILLKTTKHHATGRRVK